MQQGTIRKAQKFLKDQGFFHESLDGRPSPGLEEGILGYQRMIKLPLTGRFDIETLGAMRLLPGRGGAPMQPAPRPATSGKPLRGVWVE